MDLDSKFGSKQPIYYLFNSENRTAGSIDNFSIEFPQKHGRISHIAVIDVRIPYIWDVVDDSNKIFSIILGGSEYSLEFTPGYYTPATLIGTLTTLLQDINSSFSVSFISNTSKINIIHPTLEFSLKFSTSSESYKILGFNPFYDDSGNPRPTPKLTYTAEIGPSGNYELMGDQSIDLSPWDYICIKCPTLISSQNQSFYIAGSSADNNILSMVPITCNHGEMIAASIGHFSTIKLLLDSRKLSTLNFKLTGTNDKPIQNMKKNWSIIIALFTY